ncbi:hypothetical protein DASC09_059420 [Saccharomycopsis crataegensis]|uniref:Oxo-4-hydroxy-4-carboxy-5-ureidoimidazoline decarboxylase domain-containing protein n=1 Tax=Saccharomycopsis crataegensis TaxID=43959 RepID=A0AAV5QUS0_9ASCO|nr:hypothetical protein DASC09_059420 [Saccharomycopsis crataegensis]
MSNYKLPPISEVCFLSESQQKELLDHLFEHCETLHGYLIPKLFQTPEVKFATYKDFIEQVRLELLWFLSAEIANAKTSGATIDPRISKIIAAHPRLGAPKKQQVVNLSVHSAKEQASLSSSSEEEKFRLQQLNDLYESTFPGLRYVVFVNGRSRDIIMKNMEERIQRNDINEERKEAFNAMCDIALDRATKLGAKL